MNSFLTYGSPAEYSHHIGSVLRDLQVDLVVESFFWDPALPLLQHIRVRYDPLFDSRRRSVKVNIEEMDDSTIQSLRNLGAKLCELDLIECVEENLVYLRFVCWTEISAFDRGISTGQPLYQQDADEHGNIVEWPPFLRYRYRSPAPG